MRKTIIILSLLVLFVSGFYPRGRIGSGGHHSGLLEDDHTQYLLADGSRALTGSWNAGNFDITTTGQIFCEGIDSGSSPITTTGLGTFGTLNAGDGGTTNYAEVSATGDLTFVGSAGLPFAQIYEEDGSSTLGLAAQDTAYQITAFSVDGESNNATPDHTNDHITIVKSGMYLATLNVSFSQTTAVSIEYDFHIKKNNGATDFPATSAHRNSGGASAVGNASATGIIDLTAGDTVEAWVERLDGGAVTRTITIAAISITLVQLGGT
jgi:hypothetical protein